TQFPNSSRPLYFQKIIAFRRWAEFHSDIKRDKRGMDKETTARTAFTRHAKGCAIVTGLLLATVALTKEVVMPVAGLAFPRAEQYLAQEGLDPALARGLSDRQIRVRMHNFSGVAHSLMEMPFIPDIRERINMLSDPVAAYTSKRGFLNDIFNQCFVTVPASDVTARDLASMVTGIPANEIEHLPVSDREMRIIIMLHEFRHCHRDNAMPPPLAESDADDEALRVAMRVFANPEIMKTWHSLRAMDFESTHDTSLYLRYSADKAHLPTAALLPAVNQEAETYMKMYLDKEDQRPRYILYAEASRKALAQHGAQMSDLARSRLQLYLEAAEYFAPSAMAAAKNAPEPPTPQLSL
ncbi:MAG TPA: hypothetical protein VIG74_04595, partial [Alphaproteobacteria bacterium]